MQVRRSLMEWWKMKAVRLWNRQMQDCVWGRKCWSRWVPAVCGAISGQRPGGWNIHPSLFLALPVGPHCHVSWENGRLLGMTIDQLLRRCFMFAGLYVDTQSLSPRQLKPVLDLVFNLCVSAPSGKIMLHFSALVCPGLATSPGDRPSLALLVMLILNNRSKETGGTTVRGVATAALASSRHLLPRRWPLIVSQIPYWSCPHLGHSEMPRQQGCLGGGFPGACPPPWEAGTGRCQLPRARRKVDQGNQVTAEMGCSFAICRKVWESLTCQVRGRCPRRWEYHRLLSLLGYEGQGGLCWQMVSPVQSAGSRLHPATAANQCQSLCSPNILFLAYFYL